MAKPISVQINTIIIIKVFLTCIINPSPVRNAFAQRIS
jgi:hypothetical protein